MMRVVAIVSKVSHVTHVPFVLLIDIQKKKNVNRHVEILILKQILIIIKGDPSYSTCDTIHIDVHVHN